MEYFPETSSPPNGEIYDFVGVKANSFVTRYLTVLGGTTFPSGTGITSDLTNLTDVNIPPPLRMVKHWLMIKVGVNLKINILQVIFPIISV